MCFVKICDKLQHFFKKRQDVFLKKFLRNFDSNFNKSVANGYITSGFANVVQLLQQQQCMGCLGVHT